MNCRSCGEPNNDGAPFCSSCGEPLTRICRSCDTELRPGARFCDHCGTPVEGTTPDDPAPRDADTVADDAAVRKTVTVLFADLVGSTAFGERVDAESARQEMAEYFDLARTAIDENDGTLVKYTGDGVMAVFGIPEVAEDDALRAVNAGADLQARFGRIASHVEDQYGIEIGLRVGVNTGEVVVAEHDADIVGDAINTAARIEAACPPGQVLVGEPTWRLTRSAVDYEPLGEVSVKGKEEPIATYQVLSRAHEDELLTPFVGRDAELARLTDAFDTVLGDGVTRLAIVIGDPGVGKTRLARELRDTLADRARTFELRVEQSGGSTFGPVADLVRTAIRLEDGSSPEDVDTRIRDFLGADLADAPRLAPLLAGFVGAAPTRSTEESFWATRRLLEVLARDRPVILVVDDVQWAEPLFLDLLDHLVDWVGCPVLVVGLARPELRDMRPSLAEIGSRVCDVVNLEGLDALATETLAAQILGTDQLPAGLSRRLPESTDGNPLFVRELVRMLVDDGVITRTNGRWELAIDSEAVDVPPTIQSLLASRVERMAPAERRVVEMASVVGSEFALGAIRHLMPTLDPGELDRTLERLRRKNIVEPTGAYWGDQPLLRFHHVLFRDAAYRRLLKQRRVELHLRTARWTEEVAARLSGEHEIAIAHHYEQAHAYLTELGSISDDTAAIGRRAAELFHRAAQHALGRDDLAAAGTLSTRALARLGPDASERAEVLLIACEAFLSLGDMRAARPLLDELAALSVADDRLGAWTDAFDGQWVVLAQPERLGSSEVEVAGAADRLEHLDDQAGVAKARLVRALILARLGRVGDCEAELDRALTAARAADDRRRITAVLGAAPLAALWGPSPVARAGGRCLDIIRLLRITSASPIVEATSIRCQGVLEAMRGRFDQARDLIDRAREVVEDLGTTHGLLDTDMNAGIVELIAGNPQQAESFLRDAYEGLRLLGVGTDAGQAAALLARALVVQGRLDEAEEMAIDSDALAGQNLQTAIGSRATRAEIATARGDHGEALALAEEAVALAAPTDLTFNHARAVASLAMAQARAGDPAGAASSWNEARRLFESKGAIPFTLGEAPVTVETVTTSPPAGPVTTRAGMLGRDFWERLLGQRDLDGALDLVADDAVITDRRRMLHDSMPGSALRELLLPLVESETSEWDYRILAVRGEDLCVSSTVATSPGSTFDNPIVGVAESDTNGHLSRFTVHDPGNLHAAIEELDRLWAAADPGVPIDLVDAVRSFLAAFGKVGPETIASWLTDDFSLIDHRELGLPELDAAGYLDATAVTVGQVGEFVAFASQVHALSPTRILVTTARLASAEHGGDVTWSALDLLTVRDGRIAGLEIFTEGNLDRARARFDQLESGSAHAGLTNAASELGRALRQSLYDHRDLGATLDLLADDFVSENRRRLGYSTMTSADLGQWFEEILEFEGHSEWEHETIAVRGDDLALARWVSKRPGSEFGNEILWLLERDREGRLAGAVIFDPEDLYDAVDQLDQKYAEHLDDGSALALLTANRGVRYSATGDYSGVAAIMSDDCVSVDNRLNSFGVLDKAGQIDRIRARHELNPGFTMIITTVHRVTPSGVVIRARITQPDPVGEWDYAWLCLSDRGLITRLEYFEHEDLDAALTRFDELEAASSGFELTNRASRASRAIREALFDRQSFEEFRSKIRDDWEADDHRRNVRWDVAADSTQDWFDDVVADRSFVWSQEVVAVRADDLALVATSVRDTDAAFTSEFLEVLRVDEKGLMSHQAIFDPDQLYDAIGVLDDWYAQTVGSGGALPIRVADRASRYYTSGDYDELSRMISDDFVSVDHRFGSFGELDGAGWLDRGRSLHDVAPGFRTVHVSVVHMNDLGVVTRTRTTTESSSVAEWDLAGIFLVDGDLLTVNEFFEFEDLDRALARFDELTRDRTRPDHPATRAERVTLELIRIFNDQDFESMAAMLVPRFTIETRRPLGIPLLDAGEFVKTIREIHDVTADVLFSIETVATRGDRFVLGALRWGGVTGFFTEILMVNDVDEDGRLRRSVTFDLDQLYDALGQLDDWHAETVDRKAALSIRLADLSVAQFTKGDLAGLEHLMTDDFVSVDHRPSSFGKLDRAGTVDRARSLHEVLAPGFEIVNTEIHRVTDRGVVTRTRTSDPGSIGEWDYANVYVVAGDRLSRIEYFDFEDLDGALARFDELTVDPAPVSETRPTTLIERASIQRLEALDRRDFEALASLAHPEYKLESRRPLGSPSLNREEWLATVRQIVELYQGARFLREPVATRGEHLGLHRVRWASDYEFFTDGFFVDACDDEGRFLRSATFDPDQFDEAIEMLDDWYVESLTGDTRVAVTTGQRFIRSWTSGDVDAIESLLSDDFVCADHRLGMFDDLDKPGMLERMRSIHEVVPGFSAYMVSTGRICPFGGVGTGKVTSTDGFEWDIAMIMLSTGGRITRIEYFEGDDLEAAFTRFDELIADVRT